MREAAPLVIGGAASCDQLPKVRCHQPRRGVPSSLASAGPAAASSGGELAQTKPADAVKAYDELAADASLGSTLQDLAAVRAGMLMVDTASLAEMQRRLDPVAQPGHAFRHNARELLALSAWRNHDFTAARRYIDMIAADGETPPGTRARADVLSALIAADGSKS